MVVKEFLIESGVDLTKFRIARKNAEPAPRRQLNRMYGGQITTPVPRTTAAIRETLKSKIMNGEYRLGEIITPRRYKKLLLHPDGTLKEEYFTVSGRKVPLLEIRKILLEEHEKEGLVRDHSEGHYNAMATEEIKSRLRELGELKTTDTTREELLTLLKSHERTRHIMIWSDHSSIMNHGHILLTANAIYDPVFYYTSVELHGKDVQDLVEKPHIYIMARCRDTTEDQLMYSETRLEDARQLDIQLLSRQNARIKDVCRFFHGDHPSQEVEAGEQIGGGYGCCGCTGASANYINHVGSLRAPHISLEDRRKKVLEGPAGRDRRNGGVHPFKTMSKEDLVRECKGRHLPTDGLLKPALETQLKEDLKGIQRVPALSFPAQTTSMKELNLGSYEVVPVEPLHDLKEHINNILKELPKHLNDAESTLFEEALEAVLSTKEKLRGSDYRLCCVVLALHLGSNCRLSIKRLLNTLAELCELLYAPADKRTPRFILRLHNVAFSHVIAVRKVIQIPQVLTYRKMFGIYYHSITCHAPLTSRLISLSSVDTEEEEREFSTINSISKSTSNGHPEHIIPNSIIRVQAERSFRSKKSAFVDQQSKIGKFANNLPDLPDTIISDELLATELYQVHLEQISDFLLCGRGVWWHANEESKEIIFHDGKGQPEFRAEGPPMHHFRSSSFKSEKIYLKEKWDECLAQSSFTLPIRKVKVYDSDGDLESEEYYRVFLSEPWPMAGGSQNEQSECSTKSQNEDNLPVENHMANGQEEEESQPLICTTLISTLSVDEGELSDDESDECTENVVNSPANDKQSTTPPTAVQNSVDADSNIQLESEHPANHTDMGNRDECETGMLQTKLAQSVSKILGVTPLVKTLDMTRKALHKNQGSKYHQDRYQDSLANVQTQVLAAHQKASKELEKWEREFLVKHGFAPTYENYKTEEITRSAYKKKKLSRDLLRHWKITVHLQ